jgi:hypothetical protein
MNNINSYQCDTDKNNTEKCNDGGSDKNYTKNRLKIKCTTKWYYNNKNNETTNCIKNINIKSINTNYVQNNDEIDKLNDDKHNKKYDKELEKNNNTKYNNYYEKNRLKIKCATKWYYNNKNNETTNSIKNISIKSINTNYAQNSNNFDEYNDDEYNDDEYNDDETNKNYPIELYEESSYTSEGRKKFLNLNKLVNYQNQEEKEKNKNSINI